VLSAASVQGEGSPQSVVRALQRLYDHPGLDLVILARGGGSLEDLWSFNDERVVRAVVNAPIPIIVGVGHESDTTLADFAADLRAPTPSAAAELATPDASQLATIVDRLRDRAGAALLGQAASRRSFLDAEARALGRLAPDIGAARQRAADLLDRGSRTVADRIERRRLALDAASDALRTLSPTATLERGYAVARTERGKIVHEAATLHAGDRLQVIVARGSVDTRVERTGSEELIS
jgi:exodeoxyribonuclease VII large subunit